MATYISVSLDDLAAYVQEQTNGINLRQIMNDILSLQSATGTGSALISDLRSDVSTLQANMTQAQSDISNLADRVSLLENP